MILKTAFNALTRLHSRAATLKRLGTPDIYSPVRVTPSNYFRYLQTSEQTVVHGREFILPVDTITGHYAQLVTFASVPTTGKFQLVYGATPTTDILFSAVD